MEVNFNRVSDLSPSLSDRDFLDIHASTSDPFDLDLDVQYQKTNMIEGTVSIGTCRATLEACSLLHCLTAVDVCVSAYCPKPDKQSQ